MNNLNIFEMLVPMRNEKIARVSSFVSDMTYYSAQMVFMSS